MQSFITAKRLFFDTFATFGRITGISRYMEVKPKKGYSVLLKSWENFLLVVFIIVFKIVGVDRFVHRLEYTSDVMNADITNNCTLYVTGRTKKCINVGSYNYLGFADDWHSNGADQVLDTVEHWPVSLCNSRMDFGNSILHEELENQVAKFVGKEAALVYTMGYNTNVVTLAALMGEGHTYHI